MNHPIRVLVVEDSDTVREHLCSIIEADPRLTVAAAVVSGEAGLDALRRVRPDVISLDIRLPGMDGFEFTRRVMAEWPTPIVVASSSIATSELNITMRALEAGALTVVEKPRAPGHPAAVPLARRLCDQLVIMAPVRLVRQRFAHNGAIAASAPSAPTRSAAPAPPVAAHGTVCRGLGIVASTGGPSAVTRVLRDLGPDPDFPVFLVQHITPAFVVGFVDWLGSVVPQRVVMGCDGLRPVPGTVYVAPARAHLSLGAGALRTTDGPDVSGQKPSGTVLLRSMADQLGSAAAGVVLTGMGDDGAVGLLDIRRAGGFTAAEAEESAVVYGMPRVAAEIGAALRVLPLSSMGEALRSALLARRAS